MSQGRAHTDLPNKAKTLTIHFDRATFVTKGVMMFVMEQFSWPKLRHMALMLQYID